MHDSSQPSISVVIPSYNRPRQVARCLASLAASDYRQSDFEVVIVDDGGHADLQNAVKAHRSTLNLEILRTTNRGPAAARNSGAAIAKGVFVAFTDDDCLPSPQWLSAMAARLSKDVSKKCIVGGLTRNMLTNNIFSSASHELIEYLYAYYQENSSPMRFFTSNNIACKTVDLVEFGGFSEEFGTAGAEDRDFCTRWLRQGNEMVYEPEATVFHAHDLTLKSFWRQHENYGAGAYIFHRRKAREDGVTIKIEPIRFYAGLVASPFKNRTASAAQIAALLFISQVANAHGFFTSAIVNSSKRSVATRRADSELPNFALDRV